MKFGNCSFSYVSTMFLGIQIVIILKFKRKRNLNHITSIRRKEPLVTLICLKQFKNNSNRITVMEKLSMDVIPFSELFP